MLNNSKLTIKIPIAIAAAIFLVVTVAMTLIYWYANISEKDFSEEEVKKISNRLDISLVNLLWAWDQDAIHSVMQAEMASNNVHAILLYSDVGKEPIVGLKRNNGEVVSTVAKPQGDFFVASNKIEYSGTYLGRVEVYFTDAHLIKALNRYMQIAALGSFIFVGLLTVAIVLLMRKTVIKPIQILKYGIFKMERGDLDYNISAAVDDEIGQLTNSFIKMRKAVNVADVKQRNLLQMLEARNEELKNIIYIISHDLKVPLLNIDGYAHELKEMNQELQDKALNAKVCGDQSNYIENIIASTQLMRELLDSVLRLSRFGRFAYDEQYVDMNNLVNEVVKNMGFNIKQENADIVINDLPHCVGDKPQLSRVFTNLINNALKFRKKDVKPEIELNGQKVGNSTIYSVMDNGIGIDPTKLDKVFNIFSKADPSSEAAGEGLGLYFVKVIAMNHGGRAWAESNPDSGSQFFFEVADKEFRGKFKQGF